LEKYSKPRDGASWQWETGNRQWHVVTHCPLAPRRERRGSLNHCPLPIAHCLFPMSPKLIADRFLHSGLFALLLTCGCAVFPLGCNLVGPAAYIIEGPPTIEAQHTLADVPTLVFIDDRNSMVSPASLRRVIADKTSEDLMVKKLVSTTISPQDAMSFAAQVERHSQIMSIEEIGKKVGAKQVIYVHMLQFNDQVDYTPQPTAVCRVHVIDVENRVRTFPPPDSQEPSRVVQAMTREVNPELYRTRAGRTQLREALARETGAQIGKLFYKHERKELGGSLNPR
jgi:hypothetical protein